MCDYSLGHLKNRLAKSGEKLSFFKCMTGSVGLASPAQALSYNNWRRKEERGIAHPWAGLMGLDNNGPAICAVCIPPGAQLQLSNIPSLMQETLRIGPGVAVTFIQLSAQENVHRDALMFPGGKTLLLAKLGCDYHVEDVVVEVVSTEGATEREQVAEAVYSNR